MKAPPNLRMAVYCASNGGAEPIYEQHATRLGLAMARASIGLVYGGGGEGLMGSVARAVHRFHGHVTSVIPERLRDAAGMLRDPDERHVVSDYHQRKRRMLDLSDGCVALAGGPGTLEELAEQIAWLEVGAHNLPVLLLNSFGYWDPLLEMLARMHSNGFTRSDLTHVCRVVNEPEEVVGLLLACRRAGTAKFPQHNEGARHD